MTGHYNHVSFYVQAVGVLFGLANNTVLQTGFQDGWLRPEDVYNKLKVPTKLPHTTGYCTISPSDPGGKTIIFMPQNAQRDNGGRFTFKVPACDPLKPPVHPTTLTLLLSLTASP